MKTVLLLGGPAAGQRVEVHGTMRSYHVLTGICEVSIYQVVPMCSHGEVHWFGVLDGADPLALLIAGYKPVLPEEERFVGMLPTLGAPYGAEPARVEVCSATRVQVDKYGSTSVVPDAVEARRLLREGYSQIGPDTFRKEFYE